MEGGGVGEVGGELGKSEKREKEYGDTCVVVGPVSPSVEVLGVSAPEWGDKKEKEREKGDCWWRSGPGVWLSWPPSPGGLSCENPEGVCVCAWCS